MEVIRVTELEKQESKRIFHQKIEKRLARGDGREVGMEEEWKFFKGAFLGI